jgi:hypothetical protein
VDVRDAILRAVPVFLANQQASFWDIRDRLVEVRIPRTLATDLIEFLPLALSRAVLQGMGIGFKDYYIRLLPSGEALPPKKLVDEPVFREGLAMAGEIRRGGEAGFLAVLLCSSEFAEVNDSLNAGSKPENLDHAPQIIMARDDDPRTFAPPSESSVVSRSS